MREFYTGGPRTYGTALLIVAIALQVGWLRSSLGTDEFLLEATSGKARDRYCYLRSSDNAIRLVYINREGRSVRKDEALVVPYAVIVPPLSLLAAYLMLKRPQRQAITDLRDGDRHD